MFSLSEKVVQIVNIVDTLGNTSIPLKPLCVSIKFQRRVSSSWLSLPCRQGISWLEKQSNAVQTISPSSQTRLLPVFRLVRQVGEALGLDDTSPSIPCRQGILQPTKHFQAPKTTAPRCTIAFDLDRQFPG